MLKSLDYLGRRVRLKNAYECGVLGPNGQQIGGTIDVPAGSEGLVISHRPGLTIRLDDTRVFPIKLTKDDVDLLPR